MASESVATLYIDTTTMPESEMSGVTQPGAAPPPKDRTAEGAESHASDKAGSTPVSTGRASARYAGATATSTVARTSLGPNARSSVNLSKQPTRSSPSAHRSTASTSMISHRSAPSVSVGEDEQKAAVKSASRRESAIVSSPAGVAAEKKASAAASVVTSRRSTAAVGAASPKPIGQRTRTGGSSESVSTPRAAVSRGAASSNAAADARKRTSAPGLVTTASRPSTRTSVRSEAHIDSPKILDELTSKLAEKDKEIESLKVELTSFESTVAELRHQLDGSDQQSGEGDSSKDEQKDAPDAPKTDYDAIIRDLESQLLEKAEKLRTVDAELIEAVRIKDQGGEALEELQKELEDLRIESEEKLRVTESQLEQTIREHTVQVEMLQASVSDKAEADATATDLKSTLEAAVEKLQHQVDELTTSKADLELTIHAVKSERDALSEKISNLENEILDFKSRLAISETALQNAEANTNSEKAMTTKIQSELVSREMELESARKAEAELQNTIDDIKAALTSRDDEISGLKAMHDERMKQLSQDYENEIESLRGDAFFKRKFEELEKQHNELQISMAEDSEKHTKALVELEEGRLSALSTLEAKQLEYEEQLAEMRGRHAEELTTAKSQASETMDAHVKELDSVKARCDEQLRLAVADGEAAAAEHAKSLQISHEKMMDEFKRLHEEEKQELLASHESNLAAATSQHASELAALQTKLEEEITQLEKSRSSSAEEFEASKRELRDIHAAEVEKLATAHTEAVASLREEGLRVKQKIEELTIAYKRLESALDESKLKNTSFEEQLSFQIATNANLQASLKAAQDELVAVQAEADDVGQQLVLEKVERMTALAELDAVKTMKPDNTAINKLKAELVATTKSFQDSLAAAKADLQACEAELKSVKADFHHMEEKHTATRESFAATAKDLEELRIVSQMREKTAQADYNDLNDSMTALVEEANKKVKESEMNVEQLVKKLDEAELRYDQLQAQLKIKDAELAEAERSQ
ncbi:viral a-type inclusion repeat domain-containing [Trichoderma cornu-damae]|uniref:Viral a-type inclusion repeat domain-containing n=1 Tax=Trichoderma cornu-damae TaxID=654480 RepID=A0A9P8QM53_9HYPO|nr:viral a-type inclusion repeat domain-containing [Trichoderma cornu-damae]